MSSQARTSGLVNLLVEVFVLLPLPILLRRRSRSPVLAPSPISCQSLSLPPKTRYLHSSPTTSPRAAVGTPSHSLDVKPLDGPVSNTPAWWELLLSDLLHCLWPRDAPQSRKPLDTPQRSRTRRSLANASQLHPWSCRSAARRVRAKTTEVLSAFMFRGIGFSPSQRLHALSPSSPAAGL